MMFTDASVRVGRLRRNRSDCSIRAGGPVMGERSKPRIRACGDEKRAESNGPAGRAGKDVPLRSVPLH